MIGAAAGVLAVAGVALAANCPGPDTFGHTCTDLNTTSQCLAEPTGAALALTGDDACTAVALPFTYKHYGTSVTTIGVGTNGQIVMGGCGSGSTTFGNACLPTTTFVAPGAVAGHWDDMNFGGNPVSTNTTGSSPNRVFSVNYNAITYFSGGGSASWQVQFFENGGNGDKVRVRVTSTNGSNSFTSGIEKDSTDSLQKVCNTSPAPPANPWCTEFSKAASTGGGGGGGTGSCDLSPIEKKLDNLVASTGPLAKLETKLDQSAAAQTAAEAKLDALNSSVGSIPSLPCQMYRLLNPRLPGKPDAAGSRCLGLLPTTCPNAKACVE